MTIGGPPMRAGMEVVDVHGVQVGRVASVGETDFLLERLLDPAVTMPFTAVRNVSNGRVVLVMRALDLPGRTAPTADVLSAAARTHIHDGMPVAGADGVQLGTVQGMRGSDVLVDRGQARDVYVPYDMVENVVAGRVVIEIPADQVDQMGWPGN